MKTFSFLSIIQKRIFFYTLLVLTGLFIGMSVFGIISYTHGLHVLQTTHEEFVMPRSLTISGTFLWVAFSLNILLIGICVFIAIKMYIAPVENISKTTHQLAEEDGPALLNALAEMSQGNLSKRLALKSRKIGTVVAQSYLPIIDFVNVMIENLLCTADEFNNLTETISKRLCYVGADSFIEGQKMADVIGQATKTSGQILVMTGSMNSSSQTLRRNGFKTTINAKYPRLKIVDVVETFDNPKKTSRLTKLMLQKYPKLSAIYVTDGTSPPAIAQVILDEKKKGKIAILAHDLTDETMAYVKNRTISATLSQNPYAQGYNAAVHLFNALSVKWEPATPRMLIQPDVVTPANYYQYWNEDVGPLQTAEMIEKLTRPLCEVSDEPVKIAVLGLEDSAVWQQIREGVLAAEEMLQSRNAELDWIVPRQKGKKAVSRAKLYGMAIESLVEQGYQGIACPALDFEIIEYINRVSEKEIPIVTYNSEPFSLRSLIAIFISQSRHLLEMSQNLASRIIEVNSATNEVDYAMKQLSSGAGVQMEQVEQTRENLNHLLISIDMVSSEADASSKGTEETSKAVTIGTEAMERSFETMKKFEDSVTGTWHIVEELGEHSEKIDKIVDFITDIASRVNVLALNAAIEATQAGEQGKGFMVVAKEIRKLAANTSKATGEITELVNTVKIDIKKVEKIMADGLAKIKKSTKLYDDAGDALGSIQSLVEVDQQRLDKIVNAMTQMQNLSDEVGKAMNQVAGVSRKNTTTAEEVSVATDAMARQLEIVSQLTQKLEDIAQGEQALIAKFVVD